MTIIVYINFNIAHPYKTLPTSRLVITCVKSNLSYIALPYILPYSSFIWHFTLIILMGMALVPKFVMNVSQKRQVTYVQQKVITTRVFLFLRKRSTYVCKYIMHRKIVKG